MDNKLKKRYVIKMCAGLQDMLLFPSLQIPYTYHCTGHCNTEIIEHCHVQMEPYNNIFLTVYCDFIPQLLANTTMISVNTT